MPGPLSGLTNWSDHLTTGQAAAHRHAVALRPVSRRLVPQDVFDQLLGEVVGGELAAGDALPSERRLAELLGVSRPAVREALQRLSEARLVEVRHGGSTTVRDFRTSAGLDLLPRLLVREGHLDAAVGQSILQARQAIAPTVAALAAASSAAQAATALEEPLAALEAAPDTAYRQRAALAFWDAVVDLADSIVYRLLFNSLRAAYEPAITALGPVMEAEVDNLAGYRHLASAIAGGSPEEARAAADAVLLPAAEALGRLFGALEPPHPRPPEPNT